MSGKSKKGLEGRFQQVCPRRLSNLPDAPCPLALERIQALQGHKSRASRDIDSLKGCDWYCTASDSNYCFFSQVSSDPGPYTDEDIATLLSISTAQVAKTNESGMVKLRGMKDSESMQELKDMLQEVSARQTDNTVYLPDNFVTDRSTLPSAVVAEEDPEVPVEKKPRKKNHMYGLYSQETLKRIKRERDATAKPKDPNKKD